MRRETTSVWGQPARGPVGADAHDAVRRLADLTRGRKSIQQLPVFAAQLLGTSSAHVAFLSDKQEVQAGVGLGAMAVGLLTPTEESMCSVTVGERAPVIIEDALDDPRVSAMPPVTSGAVRSYLGVPLEVRGLVVGALCVFDENPRRWSDNDVELIQGLASPILAELELAAIGQDYESERVIWQLAVDAAEVGAFDWYLETDDLRWDDRLLKIFGLDDASFGGTIAAFNEIVHPDDRERVGRALRDAIDTCGRYAAEYRIVRPDGEVRWVSAHGRALAGPDGRAVRLVGAASDTTAAAEAETRVRRVLEAMPSAFFHLDREWRFAYVNDRAAQMLDAVSSKLVGSNIWETFPDALGSDFERYYRQAVATGAPVEFEAYYPPPLDTWYDVRAWPTPDGLSVYFFDATDRRRAQEHVEASRDRAELLSAVSEVLTGTLHPEAAAVELARLVVGPLADWSIVSLIEHPAGSGRSGVASVAPMGWRRGLRDVAGWHADPAGRDLVERYLRVRIPGLTDVSLVAQAIEQDRSVVVPSGAVATAADVLAPGEARDVLAELAPHGLGIFPLRARGRTLGLLTVARHEASGPFTDAEVDVLLEIAARAGLSMDNARLYSEQRDLATQLQRSLLTSPPASPDLEIAVRYMPAAETAQVGGDWYDAFACGDGSTVVVIGDVVGHNTEAAAAMGQLRGVLRGIAVGTEGGPAEILSSVDAAMRTLQLETLATTVVARLTPTPDGSLMAWSNAGHPLPMVLRSPGGPVVEAVTTAPQLLLGLDPAMPREETTIDLPRGAVVFFYTDGLVERRHEGIETGIERLRVLLESLLAEERSLEAVCDRVLAELLPPTPEDDVALVAVRVRA